MTPVAEGVFISQCSLAVWFGYFGQVS